MKNYCIMSIEKIHSMGSLQTRHKHNFRNMKLRHVDLDMSYKNEELVSESGDDYRTLWYRRIKEVELQTGKPVAVRKGAVLAYEVVTSFSREAEVDLEKWKEANIQWMKDTFGADNVLSMELHMDETTPHIHAVVTPIDDRGHLCAKSFTGGRSKMFRLQSSYGKAMEPLGLSRAEMYSRSNKEDLGRFYKSVNKAAKSKAPEIEAGEKVDDYVSRVNKYIQDKEMEILFNHKKHQRELELEKTYHDQFCARYGEAIRLQDDLEESFGGDMKLVRERLRTYRLVEHSVPRKTLDGFLKNILVKFPIVNNVLAFNERRKKKRTSNIDIEK